MRAEYCRVSVITCNINININVNLGCKLKLATTKESLTPFTPFFSLSSMKRERYSGDLGFRLRKCSKSEAIICLKILSLLKELWRKWSNLSLRSSRFCNENFVLTSVKS
jgi:hypothetical protein